MNQDTSSSRTDTPQSSPYQNQQTRTAPTTGTDPTARRVGVYDRPNRPATKSSSMMGTILFLIAIAIAAYYFFFTT